MQYRAFKQMHELHVVLQIIISYILKTTLLTFVFSNRCVQIAYASSHIQTLTPLYQVSQTLGLSLQCLVFYAQIYSPWLWKFCHKSSIHKVLGLCGLFHVCSMHKYVIRSCERFATKAASIRRSWVSAAVCDHNSY